MVEKSLSFLLRLGKVKKSILHADGRQKKTNVIHQGTVFKEINDKKEAVSLYPVQPEFYF